MLSPVRARSQQAASRSYVCLSCRLNAEERRRSSARDYSQRIDRGPSTHHLESRTQDGVNQSNRSEGSLQKPAKRAARKERIALGAYNSLSGLSAPPKEPRGRVPFQHSHGQTLEDDAFTSEPRFPPSQWKRHERPLKRPYQAKLYHTSSRQNQQVAAALSQTIQHPDLPIPPSSNPTGIRAELRRWQELHGEEAEKNFTAQLPTSAVDDEDEGNTFTKLDDASSLRQKKEEEEEDEAQAIAYFTGTAAEDMGNDQTDPRFLHMGDLVELEFTNSEKPSLLAIYIRRNGAESQFYTIQGRWVHLPERQVQHAIPGWMPLELVEPIIPYLPTEEQMEDADALQKEAYMKDLSVPRWLAAPLVTRMSAFQAESLEIYRKHATALDSAHELLAHDTDLRYGSLTTAATSLLKIPAHEVSLVVLYTVRKALMDAGFGFNIDRRSHRTTGYLQIRSKEQVKMVETVRMWLREWQDDLAQAAGMSQKQLERHRPSRGATYVTRFLKKVKSIIEKSRKNRDATPFGTVGPSKIKRAITPNQQAVKITTDVQFDVHDAEFVRFIEAWACNNMFIGLPRIASLPPLLLQASGMYPEPVFGDKGKAIGFIFLQEIGTIMPYENRVRFDQHLLLPTSQHSKPLANLMMRITTMSSDKADFHDSMAELRHDWGDLPVYCIDAASAHEIDDGISVERAESNSDKPEWWVHIHIANPTAFFDRDHPLARMARHMGESIYMPERAYMMLPSWATHKHFSLAKDRPCLTFSARMNAQGQMLDKKVTAGLVRNVLRITPSQAKQLIGLTEIDATPEVTLTVGGDPPVLPTKANSFSRMTEANIQDLKTLQSLAEGRTKIREAAGGIFFDSSKPELSVWQRWAGSGLAWDHPHRKGSRTVEGDPVIQMTTNHLTNYFTAAKSNTDIMVREMMLLACEVSTAWCADRHVPTIYRGSVRKPNQVDSATFYRETCEPAMAKNGGEIPLHLALSMLQTQGSVILSTAPLKHNMLGLDHYGKVTSPLRRYGDMILHWQIEAVLREEARTGRSLLDQDPTADRAFLPFSRPVLETISTGLGPREMMITRAKGHAERFWAVMLLFRAHHYGEAELPKTLHAYLITTPSGSEHHNGVCEELNVQVAIERPEKYGLPAAKLGDRWECVLESVRVYHREVIIRPIRLVQRWDDAVGWVG